MQILNKRFFFSYLVFVLAFSSASATNYTISSASELSKLSLLAGDVVTMTDGVWNNQQLTFQGNGSESAPITLKAETQGEVILTGDSKLSMSGQYLVVDGLTFKDGATEEQDIISFRTSSSSYAYNCRVTNTAIINYNPWDPSEEYKWVSIYGTNNEVDYCSFVGKNHKGALMVIWIGDEANHHHIHHNYFADIPELGENGGETIRIGTSTNSMKDSYATVEYNLFEACDGEIEIISNKSCENIYRYNTFSHCEGTLTIRHGNRCNVYGNFFFGDLNKSSGGVRIIGEDHKVYNNYFQDLVGDGFRSAICLTNGVPDSPINRYFQVKNPMVVNNTIVNCKYPITIGAGVSDELTLAPTNVTMANNVVVDYVSRTQKAIVYEATPESITYSNNIIHTSSKYGDTPSDVDNSDPKLELSADIYKLNSNSPAIGFGLTSFEFMTADIEGQSRALSNDAGCDQFSEDDIINTPLSFADVGKTVGVEFDSDKVGDGENPGEDSGIKLDIFTAVASTEQNEEGNVHIASHAIDGDLSTRWSGEGIGAYIDLTLDEADTVSYIKVGHYKGDERTVNFHVLGWNTKNAVYDTLLHNVTSTLSTTDLVSYDFEDMLTNKIRFVGLGYSNQTGLWNSYTEFELYGALNNPTSIDQPSLQLSLYPNPSQGSFYIKNSTQASVDIFTLAGQQLFSQQNINEHTLINTNIGEGIYLVKIDNENTSSVERLAIIN